MKFVSSALLLSLALVAIAAPQTADPPTRPKLGEQCGTIVGQVECDTGLICCWVIPDDGKCFAGKGPADCPPMEGR
ncbi:hypothetical protein PQX77_000935 [Marasmius sp. AFHP31]|nr:hypothetical protein PQX77_000935 [Marasmius sp. AFHP31]